MYPQRVSDVDTLSRATWHSAAVREKVCQRVCIIVRVVGLLKLSDDMLYVCMFMPPICTRSPHERLQTSKCSHNAGALHIDSQRLDTNWEYLKPRDRMAMSISSGSIWARCVVNV